MSCGSPTCNSIKTLDAALPSYPDLRWNWKNPLTWLTGMALRWEREYQLRELDDRLLADIGVPRAAEEVRRSNLYMIAWRDSR
jgi:uncharacterized protein YjiS (DUF1127 family)